jgi:hypothetical protein
MRDLCFSREGTHSAMLGCARDTISLTTSLKTTRTPRLRVVQLNVHNVHPMHSVDDAHNRHSARPVIPVVTFLISMRIVPLPLKMHVSKIFGRYN